MSKTRAELHADINGLNGRLNEVYDEIAELQREHIALRSLKEQIAAKVAIARAEAEQHKAEVQIAALGRAAQTWQDAFAMVVRGGIEWIKGER